MWCGHKQLGRPRCRLGELNVSETVLDLPEDIFLLLLPKGGSEPAVENIVLSSENVQRLFKLLLAKEKRESCLMLQ